MRVMSFENNTKNKMPEYIIRDDIILIKTNIPLKYEHIQFIDLDEEYKSNEKTKIYVIDTKDKETLKVKKLIGYLNGTIILTQTDMIEKLFKFFKCAEPAELLENIDCENFNFTENVFNFYNSKITAVNPNVEKSVREIDSFTQKLFDDLEKEREQSPLQKMLKRFEKKPT